MGTKKEGKGFMKTDQIWEQVMSMKSKDTRHRGLANTLTKDEIETICATADYWGGNINLILFDLRTARYRVFDWLAMGVQGRIENKPVVKVLAYSFIKSEGDIDKWIADLRETDYDCDREWEKLEIK